MHTHCSKQVGSLFIALVMVITMLGMRASPVRAGAPASANFRLNSASTPITTITRVSVDSSGAEGNGDSHSPSISADGRYVVFASFASNLVSGDTNNAEDIFLRDTKMGNTTRISVDSNGKQANGDSFDPTISADGRYVAFDSNASNLVSGDTNGVIDVFLRDTQTNTTTRISVDSNGVQGNNYSEFPSISADGRYVAFDSGASNLVSGDTNGVDDIFLHDKQTGTTTRLSVDSSGKQGNDNSDSPSISADGHYVAFYSYASNLVSGDTNNRVDVFLRDRQAGTTTRLSVNSSGVQGNDDSLNPAISADGRDVAFSSYATNLASGASNGSSNIYLRDTQTASTTRLSANSSGVSGNGDSDFSSISGDGRYVAFSSIASNLVSGDTNGIDDDIFLRDTQMDTITRLSVDSGGLQGNNDSSHPSISGNDLYVVFESNASNLVSGDTNGKSDIFVVPAGRSILRLYLPLSIR